MKIKKILSIILSVSLTANIGFADLTVKAESPDNPIEHAEFYWDFEEVVGSDAGQGAVIKNGAAVKNDTERNSKVLELPGGGNGDNGGFLELPEIFKDVTSDGFTLSMWIKPASDSGDFTRFFDASNSPLGETEVGTGEGGGQWEWPDFGLVCSGNYDATIFVGDARQDTNTRIKMVYDKHLAKGLWQYLTVSVSPDSYKVYIDGKEVTVSPQGSNYSDLQDVLAALFADNYINSMAYASLGRCLYKSDGDFKGSYDNFAFFERALNQEEIEKLAEHEEVYMDDVQLERLFNTYSDKENTDGYTSDSWADLQKAILAADTILKDTAATKEQITTALTNLRTAIYALTKETAYSAEYFWDFESVNGTDAGQGATLEAGATVELDDDRGGKVLSLPGGNNGQGGYMQLPQIFKNVTSNGFTLSMWVKLDSNSGDYRRIFSASNSELGATSAGSGGWEWPEFGIVNSGNYDMTLFVGAPESNTDMRIKLVYDRHLIKGQWQFMTISVNPAAYNIYLDGREVKYNPQTNNFKPLETILAALFDDDYVQSMNHASIGRSLYGSDPDFQGKIDNLAFYEKAMTTEEVEELAVSEGIDINSGKLQELYEKCKDKTNKEGKYTSDSWDIFETARIVAENTLNNSSADQEQLRKVYDDLKTALEGLIVEEVDFYRWDFESVNGTDAGQGAIIKAGASVVEDAIRGKVLNMPGGSNGKGGYLELPNIFRDVTEEGFTLSMWIKPTTNAGAYTRYFAASNTPLGATNDGGFGWQSPEFGLTPGGGDYDGSIYVGPPGERARHSIRFSHKPPLIKGEWQYVSFSISPDSYRYYINGIEQSIDCKQEEIAIVLEQLFKDNYIQTMEYISVGRALYGSDGDFTGAVDNVSLYKKAMSTEEIDNMALQEGVSLDTVQLEALYNEYKDKDECIYTISSWAKLKEALYQTKTLIESDLSTITLNKLNQTLLNLKKAAVDLAEIGDKSDLRVLYNLHKGKIESDYRLASWKTFSIALSEANRLLDIVDNDVSIEQLESAFAKLEKAAADLINVTNKSSLQALYDANKNMNKVEYTEQSWNVFMTAFNEAKSVLFDTNAKQEEINAAEKKLLAAKNGMIWKSDKTKLRTAHYTYNRKSRNQYTSESWKPFSSALKQAGAVLSKVNVKQQEIDSALVRLNQTASKLITLKVVSNKKVTLGVKEKYKAPVSGLRKNCTFTTNNSKIARISSSGNVTAVKKGSTTISAINRNGNVVTLKITVKKAPKKISKLNVTKKTLKRKNKFGIKVKLPKGTASNKITYKSSKKSVASVNSKGVVTAKKKGKATITVKTFNNKKKTIVIKVK